MEKTMERLVSFVTETRFRDLPSDVVHEVKRVFMDSAGCAVAGLSTERGGIAVELTRKLGGLPESTIIGTNDRVSPTGAAFANGELINALDFDALSPRIVHVVPMVLPAALALAESAGTSGKDLVLALALGIEIPVRLKPTSARAASGKAADRSQRGLPSVSGFSVATLAAAASCSKVLGLDEEKTANAIGIAGCICLPNTFRKFTDTVPVRMTKYGPSGWGAQCGVTSALLAEMGYTGDTDLFEGELNFWRYTGQEQWKTAELPADLGIKWEGHHLRYKLYPSGGVLAGVLDKFIEIVEENDFGPEDIERIVAHPPAIVQNRLWRENTLRTPEDYTFDLLYLIACAAHRIDPVHWQDPEVRQDPRLRKFMQRIEFRTVIDEEDFIQAGPEDPRRFQMGIEITAKGRDFKEKTPHVKGSWEPAEFRITNDALIRKFSGNVAKALPLSKANHVAQTMLEMENLHSVAGLMEMIAP
jgi:2-methylcitrate dehydratase PrpD